MNLIDNFKKFFKTGKSFIRITKINTQKNKIIYNFVTSNDLKKYFRQNSMFIEYLNDEINLNNVPESILLIPLISNLLPVIWITNSKLIVDELDKTFYESIPNIKEGYKSIYKNSSLNGELDVKKLVNNEFEYENDYIELFSYGVDSLNTFLKYADYKPLLATIWGSDVSLDSNKGWKAVKDNISQFANEYDLSNFFIKSDFRQFLNTDELFDEFSDQLDNNGNWWYAVQHGIGIISMVAILAYIFKVKSILIASSYKHNKEDILNKQNIIPCASSPVIDNEFKFANCNTIHDSWELSRTQKIDNIVKYSNEKGVKFNMHVCWYSPLGINCNICEKCARTYMYLMAIGEDPNNYGFNVDDETHRQVEKGFNKSIYENDTDGGWSFHAETLLYWKENQKIFKQNEEYWRKTALNWILDINFDELINNFD